ncbi:hypothetical protein AAZX31_U034900 [Glycine max]
MALPPLAAPASSNSTPPNQTSPSLISPPTPTAPAGGGSRSRATARTATPAAQNFTSYGKNSAGAGNEFSSYGTSSNVEASNFTNYGARGTSPNDTFTNYGVLQNIPEVNFQSYAEGTVGGTESFSNYRKYAISANPSSDTFKGYAKGAEGDHKVGFTSYGNNTNTTFKDYVKQGVSFASYDVPSSSASKTVSDSFVKTGKFFRESMLKEGTVMPMPDIRDKMPPRSFLPRYILSKLPFSSSKIYELKRVFKVSDNSSMDKMIMDSFGECERAPSVGETKRCVGSVEDMIDFATSVLGRNVAVWTTENVNGFNQNIMVGGVKGMKGGKVTKSVSCHQSLFPYLLYYCHSVPKVRVYEADLLNPESKAKINHGVAICHLDTTAWSPTHGAFVALGSGPGRIEVCHWIFENDMTWTIAD